MAKRIPRVPASRVATSRLRLTKRKAGSNVVSINRKSKKNTRIPMNDETTPPPADPEQSRTHATPKGTRDKNRRPDSTRSTLGFAKRVKVYEVMKTMDPLTPSPDQPGKVSYKEGFSDESIAEVCQEKLGFSISQHNIAKIREEMWGKLARSITPATTRQSGDDLAALETAVNSLVTGLATVMETVDTLSVRVREVESLRESLANVTQVPAPDSNSELLALLKELKTTSHSKTDIDKIGGDVRHVLAEVLTRLNRLESNVQTIARVEAGLPVGSKEVEEVRRNKVTPAVELREGGEHQPESLAERLGSKFKVTKDNDKR